MGTHRCASLIPLQAVSTEMMGKIICNLTFKKKSNKATVFCDFQESVSAFPDTLKEERDSQDQIYMQKYAQLMFLLFPDRGGQRYMKMLRAKSESTASSVIKIDKMLLKYFRTLAGSIGKLLDPFHPFLLKVKSTLCFSILQWTLHVRSKLSEQNESHFM